jgi:hypothetical protein
VEVELQKERKRIDAELHKFVKGYSRDDLARKEVQQKLNDKYKEMYEAPPVKKLTDKHQKLTRELNQFMEKPKLQRFGSDDYGTAHGYVWLFLRK